MEFLTLEVILFLIVGVLLTGYILLDGFDLGIGALHLFSKTDHERRTLMNAIGPIWNGNEVWLVTAVGAIFAAFPYVYSALLSGFYILIMLLLVMLIFRAIAMEFRSKLPKLWWRRLWDRAFAFSSILIAFIAGVIFGNIIYGVPINADKEFVGSLSDLLNPYAFLVGLSVIALVMMHGSIFLVMKTEGEFQKKVHKWVENSMKFFIMCYAMSTMATLIYIPEMTKHFRDYPFLFVFGALSMLAIANIPREIHRGKDLRAFLSSCCGITSIMGLFSLGIFPNIIKSSLDTAYNLTIYNTASSQTSMTYILIIACIGVPFVLTYTIVIYGIFSGKVDEKHFTY